jgi:SAM-dependent methyltransferase
MATDWETKYQQGDTPWEKGEASPGLVDFLAAKRDLPRGRVLVPGCGFGHDVREWARAGYEVTGLDISPSAVRSARERLTSQEVARIEFIHADFLNDAPAAAYDWLFEHTLYCAIDPEQREDYCLAATRCLRPGGQFLAIHYLIPNEDGPPFGTTVDEIQSRFSRYFELVDSWVPRSYPNRTGLERIFWWRKS